MPYTRITEFKHLTGPGAPEDQHRLRVSRRPRATPTTRCRGRRTPSSTSKYEALADATPDVHFVGRLATYKYYNMDQVVGQALALYARLMEEERRTISAARGGSALAGADLPAVASPAE